MWDIGALLYREEDVYVGASIGNYAIGIPGISSRDGCAKFA